MHTKFQTPREKTGVQNKSYCLHKLFKHTEPLFSVRREGIHPSSQMLIKSQPCRQPFQAFQKMSFRPPMLTLFSQTKTQINRRRVLSKLLDLRTKYNYLKDNCRVWGLILTFNCNYCIILTSIDKRCWCPNFCIKQILH